ncbi:LuxR C-terminal-related transcriptional regulator [Amycolatopsis sp. cg9]|uniref:helix-turn-helix transcriptional regulator n=1 Tax=Amycolatopsis sp. cg9 TaxID=3238801 RepID=UPI003524F4A7
MVSSTQHDHLVREGEAPTDEYISPASPSLLPAEMNSFIGRGSLLNDGIRLLRTARLVTLIGTGGVGKTRLLLRMARELVDAGAYKHGVVVVQLADLKEADDRLESTIAGELGILDNSSTPGLARLIEYFRHRQMLLMLDNCEHLVGKSPGTGQVPRLLTTLLKAAPGLQVMTTSRVRLGVQGEHLLIVPPLCIGTGDCGRDGDENGIHEAQQLLIDRAAAAGVRISEEEYPLAARLCQLLDGIPQAIELAAPMLAAMTLQEMVEHPSRLHLLADGPHEQDHHRTLHAMIDWSYDLLPVPERRVWALVSVFEGGFDLDAAQAICGGRGVEKPDVLSLIVRLRDKSLLVTEARGGRTRYRMLETIREYGQELVAAAGEEYELRQAHAEYFDELVARCAREWFGPAEIEWMRRLQVELPNLRAAQEYFLSDPATAERGREMAIRATGTRFFVFSGKLNEARRMLAMGLDGCSDAPSLQQAAALSMSSWVALIQGSQALARPLLAQAEEVVRQLGIDEPFGPLLYGQGTQKLLTEPDRVKARESLELLSRAERALRSQGTPGDVFMTMLFLGMAASFLGDAQRAFAEAERVLAAARASGAPWCLSWALWNNALAELLHGDPDAAARLAQEALRSQQATGDTWGPTWSLWLIAIVAVTRGDYELAGQLLGGAQAGWRHTEATVLGLLPFLRVQQQAKAAARRELGDDEYKRRFEKQVELGESLRPEEIYALAATPFPTQRQPSAQEMLPGGLSDRELEVADLVAKGMSNREIGERLHISFRTVEEHIRRINRKLGVSKRVEIAAWYLAEAGK